MKENAAAFTETVADTALILDPDEPMLSARELVRLEFTTAGLRTLHRHRGAFWVWVGNYYRLAEDESIRASIWNFLDKAKVLIKPKDKEPYIAPFKPTKARVENVLAALGAVSLLDDQIEPPVWLSAERQKQHPARELFACANGLLHLPTGKLIPHTASYFGLSASEVVFNPKAPQPKKWLKFLVDAVVHAEAITALQEAFGYVLSPDTSQQKIFLGVGPRRSGKGTTGRILTKLIGHASVTGPTMSDLSEAFGLQPLITSPLAIISDARIGQRTDKARVTERLLSISGEDVMTVNRKNRPHWTGRLPTRIWIMTNELPALTDTAGALAGRFIIFLFQNSFYGREDTKLSEKLEVEISGILNWAIKGYRRLNERGHFVQPGNAAEVMDEIETLGSPIRAFLRDRCDVGPKKEVDAETLYHVYLSWAEANRQKTPNKEWWARELRAAVPGLKSYRPHKKNDAKGDKRELRYRGVGLRETM
jgi:putative DNA primase/helicase